MFKNVRSADIAGKLQAQELCNDFRSRMNSACDLAMTHHSSTDGGELLVVFVPNRSLAEEVAGAILGKQLVALAEALPQIDVSAQDLPVVESGKAVLEVPNAASAATDSEAPAAEAAGLAAGVQTARAARRVRSSKKETTDDSGSGSASGEAGAD